ncbi:uncharacterized protein RCC_04773 [Ramularia collo-cygni]|uniref:Uncharacterized protein n=1 Tax=Ramularia collo-cygni TaxID=112498 RepID=A0A2D3UUP7_9PEZI|nr:uncharacterized protein RCC_04773 [Ramularia collo-cygni]CZT18928.1 uncharacterized protein RCC_04773 [Ramularia collo-cygni]
MSVGETAGTIAPYMSSCCGSTTAFPVLSSQLYEWKRAKLFVYPHAGNPDDFGECLLLSMSMDDDWQMHPAEAPLRCGSINSQLPNKQPFKGECPLPLAEIIR